MFCWHYKHSNERQQRKKCEREGSGIKRNVTTIVREE